MTRSPGHSCLGPCPDGGGNLGRDYKGSQEGKEDIRRGFSVMGNTSLTF